MDDFQEVLQLTYKHKYKRSIEYEQRNSGDYFNNAAGFASNEGPGYGGMSDAQFSDFLWNSVLSPLRMMNFSLSMMVVEVQIKVELMQSIMGLVS